MVKFGLKWLGGVLAIYGLIDIVYELIIFLGYYGNLSVDQRGEFLDWLGTDDATAFTTDLKGDFARGIYNLALGLIMLGVKRLIDAAENSGSNITQMKAKKDLGNWPPSV